MEMKSPHYCRKTKKNGGVAIFINQFYQYEPINLWSYYHPNDNICILTVYRAPSGNYIHFLNILEAILNTIYTKFKNIILCGDINIYYLDDMGNNQGPDFDDLKISEKWSKD
jgi:exonuclease III